MSVTAYKPRPIVGVPTSSLTLRQRLAQVRESARLLSEAKSYWPDGRWSEAEAALASSEGELADAVEREIQALSNKPYLRPEFVNLRTGQTARLVARTPDQRFDSAHIPEEEWVCMRRILGEGEIQVDADYCVYVVRGGAILHVIERYE